MKGDMMKPLLLSACALIAVAALPPAQQSPTPPLPRLADGHPDFSGVYQTDARGRVGTWDEANKGIGVAEPPPQPAGAQGRGRQSGPPYQPWAAKLVLDDYNNRNVESATAKCLPNFMLLNVGLFPVEFVRTPKKLVILMEYMGLNRNIPIGEPLPDDTEPTFLGTSAAHWDGDTLVVETKDFNEQLHAGGGGGRMHSDALHTIERFTRVDYNTIKWDVVWDDPKVLTRPDEIHTQFMLRPGTRVREYICQENNQDPATYDVMKKAGDLHIRK
jgi:hypothetical protein